MRATAIGTRNRAGVGGRCPHAKTARRERVFDAEPEAEWVARLRIEDVFHENPVRLARNGPPGVPADEPMDCVVALRLVERQLMAAPVELVAAILQPVGPRDQNLPAGRGAHLLGPVAIENFPAAGGVCAKPATNLDDYRPLVFRGDLDLLATRCNHGATHASSASSARACRRAASKLNTADSCIFRAPRAIRGRSCAPWPR